LTEAALIADSMTAEEIADLFVEARHVIEELRDEVNELREPRDGVTELVLGDRQQRTQRPEQGSCAGIVPINKPGVIGCLDRCVRRALAPRAPVLYAELDSQRLGRRRNRSDVLFRRRIDG
jgi:acyl-CoA reductase-like NAD-dependent aldehyde dehydrogenase